jgi:putative hydrolase of the HAD superfamily
MIRAVIFDWGGTCTKDDIADSFCRSLSSKTGVPQKKIREAFETNNRKYLLGKISCRNFWKEFSRKTGIEKDPEFFNSLFLEAGRADAGMLELIKKVKKRFLTALLSDNYRELAEFIVREYRLKELFDVMVFSNRVGAKKPGKRIFLAALKRLGLPAEECVFIDDKARNISAAKKLGMEGILFQGREKLKKKLSKFGIVPGKI